MSNRLRKAFENLQDEAQIEPTVTQTAEEEAPVAIVDDMIADDIDTQAGAAEMVETATASLESIFELLHQTLDVGGANANTRAMAFQAAGCANLITGVRTKHPALESDMSDYDQTKLSLESLWDNIVAGIKKVIEYLSNLWKRFRDWIKQIFSRNKKIAEEAKKEVEAVQELKKSEAVEPPKSITVSHLMASYLDFSQTPVKDIKGWVEQFSKGNLQLIVANGPIAKMNFHKVHDLVKASIADKDLANIPVPAEIFENVPAGFREVGSTKIQGVDGKVYESHLFPGGYVFRLEKIENPPKGTPEEAIKYAARSNIRVIPKLQDVRLVTEQKVLSLDELERLSRTIVAAAEMGSKASQSIDEYLRDGEKLLNEVKLSTNALERINVIENRKRQQLVQETVSMMRRYMTELVMHDRAYLTYTAQSLNTYLNYTRLQLRAYKGRDAQAA